MEELQHLSNLISDIYDASLDQDRWPGVLESIVSFIGGTFGNLFAQDEAIKSATVFYSCGIPPTFQESYNTTYIRINPTFPATLFFEVERIIRQEEIMPHAEFRQTRFYKEWAHPLGWWDAAAAVLEKSAMSCAVLAIGRTERDGMFDDPSVRRMQLAVPHVRRALLIGKVLELQKVEAAALADTLDGIAAGLLLVDTAGRIAHANASALVMLAEGSVVHGVGSKLAVTDAAADRALHEIFVNADAGDTAIGGKGIAVPLSARDGERYIAHVLPLTSGARKKAGTEYSAVAAVFIRKAALDLPHPLEALADAYKLTPAEMRVLMMIVQVGGVPEVAPVLGISEATVKTHLQHIFDKTGTKRQADLVKLVAGYMSPLGG